MIRHSAPAVRLADIDRAVCAGLSLEASRYKRATVARRVDSAPHARHVAGPQAPRGLRLAKIGHRFGRRSRSTVVSAQKTVNGWVAGCSSLELHGKSWSIEDAIRRIEAKA